MSSDQETNLQVSLGKPVYHVVAQRGWMNDPCAPGRLPSGKYTVMYQWNPHSHVWDNISWGQVDSEDLVHWRYTADEPNFVPDQPYDELGIFTGSMVERPAKPGDEHGLTVFYTSVPILPIHWSTPHPRGAEGVTMATSKEGYEWTKRGPVVEREPEHLAVTGFRDPTVMPWPAMDRALSRSEPGTYALISGGLQDGPCVFLYSLDPSDLSKWTYLRPLGRAPRSLRPGRWTGDFGTNWECSAIFSLSNADAGEQRDVWMFGVEGAGPTPAAEEHKRRYPGRPTRAPKCYPWMFVSLTSDPSAMVDGVPDMEWTTSGLMDWAEFYALNTFVHPDGRRIAWGWMVEFELSEEAAKAKGWTGCLGIPRELGLKVYDDVVGLVGGGKVTDVGSFEVGANGKEGRVVTMGVDPLRELVGLRRAHTALAPDGPTTAGEAYELHISASLPSPDSRITLYLRHDPSHSITSSLAFSPSTSEIVFDRSHSVSSSLAEHVGTPDEVAPFDLLVFASGEKELLDLRVFVDRDVVELFVNGRVAMATRLYSPGEANLVSIKVEGGAEVKRADIWEMGNIGLVQ